MEEVTGRLDISIWVNCPECDLYIDILDPKDTNEYPHDDEGQILRQSCPHGAYWSEAHKDFSVEDVTCTSCKTTFNVNGLEW